MTDQEGSGGSGMMAVVMPLATAAIALMVGLAAGGGIAWVAKPAEIVEKPVPRDLTAAELEAACAPLVAEVTARLTAAQDKVTTLIDDVKSKESRVKDLEAEIEKRNARGAVASEERKKLEAELQAARAELSTVKEQLKVALEEKEQLVVELKQTLKDLETQKVETKVAQEDAISKGWTAFIGQSQLEICDKGNRKKLGRCRETVQEMVTPFKPKFDHCLRAGQEMPTVRLAEKGDTLPRFSEYIEQENKVVEDWYVMLCDPTLPEARGFAEEVRKAPSTPSDDLEFDLPEEDAP